MSSEIKTYRINKFLAASGLCSRREADRLIEQGLVQINGHTASAGEQVSEEDSVIFEGRPVCLNENFVLIAFNKPVGIECTTSHEVKNNIIDFIGFNERIFPVGRLDKNSSGLILLTNRGELNDKILRSANFHEKEYIVRTDKPFDAGFLKYMSEGVDITASFDRPLYKEGREDLRQIITRPCTVKALSPDTFSIILTQGLNRQIRRMCSTLGYNVISLKRIRILNIELNDLEEGTYRNLTEKEKTALFNLIGATDER